MTLYKMSYNNNVLITMWNRNEGNMGASRDIAGLFERPETVQAILVE